jgi:hypothetical protein
VVTPRKLARRWSLPSLLIRDWAYVGALILDEGYDEAADYFTLYVSDNPAAYDYTYEHIGYRCPCSAGTMDALMYLGLDAL